MDDRLFWLIAAVLGVSGGIALARRTPSKTPGLPGSGQSATPSTKLEAASDDALGVDVSGAQGKAVDWMKVKAAGFVFAIIKLTEGTAGIDAAAAINMAGAKAAGLLRSAYHFAHYGTSSAILDARAQARFFAAQIRAMGGIDLPPVLDFELVDSKTNLSPLSKAATCQWAKDFIDEMHNQGFPVVWLYSYPSYLLQLMPDLASSGLAEMCELWIADYGQTINQSGDVATGAIPVVFKSPTYAAIKALWPTWVCWQTHGDDNLPKGSGAPRVPGIPNAVDHDRFNGNVDQLRGRVLASVA